MVKIFQVCPGGGGVCVCVGGGGGGGGWVKDTVIIAKGIELNDPHHSKTVSLVLSGQRSLYQSVYSHRHILAIVDHL